MRLASNVFDVWTFRRTDRGARFLLLYTAEEKARRYLNDGRFWQIPSDFVNDGRTSPARSGESWAGSVSPPPQSGRASTPISSTTGVSTRCRSLRCMPPKSPKQPRGSIRRHIPIPSGSPTRRVSTACTSAASKTVCGPFMSTSRAYRILRKSCASTPHRQRNLAAPRLPFRIVSSRLPPPSAVRAGATPSRRRGPRPGIVPDLPARRRGVRRPLISRMGS